MKNLAAPSLDEWLVRARGGEPAALAVLVETQQRSVYSLALRMLGSREAAEDLAQEVFMEMTAKLATIESHAHLSFWLRRVTTHRAIDQLRRRTSVVMTSLDSDEVEAAALLGIEDEADPLWQRALAALLASLSPPARAVLLLRYQEDLDPVDIARTLDMPVNTVKSHLQRSLATLREGLRQ